MCRARTMTACYVSLTDRQSTIGKYPNNTKLIKLYSLIPFAMPAIVYKIFEELIEFARPSVNLYVYG